jgi:cell division protein ZapA
LRLVTDKQTVTLEIAGARYRMTSDADRDRLTRLAEMVNERVEALGGKAARQASPAQLLAVVALGLADDLLSAEERRRKVEGVTRKAIGEVIERIDHRLSADDTPQDGGDGN